MELMEQFIEYGDNLKTADEIFKTTKLLKYKFKGIVKRLGKNFY